MSIFIASSVHDHAAGAHLPAHRGHHRPTATAVSAVLIYVTIIADLHPGPAVGLEKLFVAKGTLMTDETQLAPRAPTHRGVYDAAVIGGVAWSDRPLAYGLRRELDRVAVLDEGDVAYRASRGNFGLVWVQSKGMGLPRYGVWTMTSATLAATGGRAA